MPEQQLVRRFKGLLRDTWWLWILFIAICGGMIYFVSPVCAVMIPILIFTFVYFGMIRYDEQGNAREIGGG